MASDDFSALLLRRLEAEYNSVVAATREPAPEAAAVPEDEEASVEAAAEGYAPIGLNVSEDESEMDEEGAGYACLVDDDDPDAGDPEDDDPDEADAGEGRALCEADGGTASDALPTSFIDSAMPTRKAYEASLLLPDMERAALEHATRAAHASTAP